jgi:hypothetical protein
LSVSKASKTSADFVRMELDRGMFGGQKRPDPHKKCSRQCLHVASSAGYTAHGSIKII